MVNQNFKVAALSLDLFKISKLLNKQKFYFHQAKINCLLYEQKSKWGFQEKMLFTLRKI